MLLYSVALVICVLTVSGPEISNAECINHPTDVIFLVDASTNNQTEFQKMLDFCINITQLLDIGVYDYKVGMLIFSRSYRRIFYLSKYNDKTDVMNAINATDLHILNRDVTDTADGLNYARRSMATTSYGHRHGADLVFVTLVSSPSSNPSLTLANAKLLKDTTGGTSIVIGIGNRVPDAELTAIASDDAHKNRVTGFGDLDSASMSVILEICPNDWHTNSPHTGAALTVDDCPAAVPRNNYLQVFRGICYEFKVFKVRTFDEATKDCETRGGTLVLIKNRETNFFIQNELYYNYHISSSTWIGLVEKIESADAGKGHYVWADGEVANYTNFGHVVGHDTDKNCIAIVPQISSSDAGRWREYHCDPSLTDVDESSRLRYICQYNVQGSPSTLQTLEPTDPSTNATVAGPSSPSTAAPTNPTTAAPNSPSTDAPTNPTTAAPSSPSTDAPTDSTTAAPTNPTTDAATTPATSAAPSTGAPTQGPTSAPTMQASTMGTTACPPFHCAVDCGLDGYKKDANNCDVCECDV